MGFRIRDCLELDTGPGRMRPMEGLRGIAVLLVFLQHYAMQSILYIDLSPFGAEVAALLRNFGTLGVELFFILSGFLIYGMLLRRRPAFRPFMARRAGRLYPAFLCVFAPVAIAHVVVGTGEIPAEWGGAALVIAANLLFLPGVVAIEPLMAVAWTLSWEMAFYLALGILVPALGLPHRSRFTRVVLILTAIALVTLASDRLPDGIGVFASPLPALPFLFGMLLFEAEDARAWSVPGIPALGAGLAALTIGHWFAPSPLGRTLMESFALAVLCSAAFRGNNIAASVLSTEKLRWLGNMSYSYYLVHGLVVLAVFQAGARLLAPGWPAPLAWLLVVPVFAASLVASFAVFAAVERPISLRPARRTASATSP
jgi:exopolysaccharide production protein ExoZ